MDPRYFCLICRRPTRGAGAECPHCKSHQVARVGATPQRLAIVFVVMLALFVGTGYYNRAFNTERQDRAEEHFRLGRTLADYGYFDGAIDQFSDALVYSRGDFEYRLGLTLALYQSGRYQEAQPQLLELRAADPTQAVVNRMLARLAVRGGRVEEAVQSYRTAIYGRWDQNPEQNRVETRLELVDFLESEGETLQLVGELLSLLREEPANDELRRRAGLMFLDAGAPGEVIRVLGHILGVVAIAKSRVEPVEEIRAHLVAALAHIEADRLIAAPDCGLGLLGRDLTLKKLRNLGEAAHSI